MKKNSYLTLIIFAMISCQTALAKPKLILIAGRSASGKSSISQYIKRQLGEQVNIISTDEYYHDLSSLTVLERRKVNGDIPSSIDSIALEKDIKALLTGKSIKRRNFDFVSAKVSRGKEIEPKDFLVVEGIFALNFRSINDLSNFRFFVDVPNDIRLSRRIVRDIAHRGYSLESALDMYFKFERPMFLKHVLPTKYQAQKVLDGTDSVKISGNLIIESIPR